MPSTKPPRKTGIVLPAGGARAAYQVGALRHMARHIPGFEPTIFSGISAGSINACFLAQGQPFSEGVDQLYDLWRKLRFQQVMNANFRSLLSMGSRWFYDLFVSKITRKLLVKSLLDASPLAQTLLEHIHFWRISKALREGRIDGVSVTCTNYHDGTSTVFFDSAKTVEPWIREQRRGIRTAIRVRHVMASCSIPILFEPIRIGESFYGDGSLRFNFPFSPAIQLGATHMLAVSTRGVASQSTATKKQDHVSIGFIAGAVMNSMFLDSIEVDFENVNRINRLGPATEDMRRVETALVRPSADLGVMARDHLSDVPFHLRQLLGATANPDELGDFLSYLMFSPGYVGALLALGEKDAAAQHDALAKTFQS